MSLEEVDNALRSLEGWSERIGCMGGEPTAHPHFTEICRLYQKYFPREQCGLWTSGGKNWGKYQPIIRETFRFILYNDHTEIGKHHPWMVAIEDVIPDKELRDELIRSCWVQKWWSPSINPKGAFFCEIAAVLDLLFDGPGGYPVEKDWWKREVADFQDQIDRYCGMCGMAIPYPCIKNDSPVDFVSKSNWKRLVEAGSTWNCQIIDEHLSREDIENRLKTEKYAPWEYLGEKGIRDETGLVTGGYIKERSLSPLARA